MVREVAGRGGAGAGGALAGSVYPYGRRIAAADCRPDRTAVAGVGAEHKMESKLSEYAAVAGAGVVHELMLLGERLAGTRVLNVNSTRIGGGVAEILNRLVPLLREVGIDAQWEVIHGTEEFFALTKDLHNALHGKPVTFTAAQREIYNEVTQSNLARIRLDADVVFIHDPQPAGLIRARERLDNQWIWRCHIDVSAPAPGSWEFIAPLVERYDLSVFSAPQFA